MPEDGALKTVDVSAKSISQEIHALDAPKDIGVQNARPSAIPSRHAISKDDVETLASVSAWTISLVLDARTVVRVFLATRVRYHAIGRRRVVDMASARARGHAYVRRDTRD